MVLRMVGGVYLRGRGWKGDVWVVEKRLGVRGRAIERFCSMLCAARAVGRSVCNAEGE